MPNFKEKVELKTTLTTEKLKSGKAKKKESKSPKAEMAKEVTISKDIDYLSSGLPTGWTRKIVERKSGKSAGMFDVYIYSPDGIKFRSRPDIAAYLERTKLKFSLDRFSFKRSLGEQLTANNAKKTASAVKNGKKLKVKVSIPKKHNSETIDEKWRRIYPFIDCKPSTSGLQSKQIGVNRKKKNT